MALKVVDGIYINRRGEEIHCYGNTKTVLVWKEVNGKPGTKSTVTVKLGCILYKKNVYYITDFKKIR